MRIDYNSSQSGVCVCMCVCVCVIRLQKSGHQPSLLPSTDLEELERLVRGVETDGLKWGASKLVPVAYGIKKLQISCVVEDEKVRAVLVVRVEDPTQCCWLHNPLFTCV